MQDWMVIGGVRIPLEETFAGMSGRVHLPDKTFLHLVETRGLQVEVTASGILKYPYEYKADINGSQIYMTSNNEHLFE